MAGCACHPLLPNLPTQKNFDFLSLFFAKKKLIMANKKLNKIKLMLVAKDKRANWLAKELDVNYNTVTNWSCNATQPSLATLYKIAEVLEVDVADLLFSRNELNK
jgi:putative transcriptional regulator